MNIEKIVEVIEDRMTELDMSNKYEMGQYLVYECISDLVRLDGWTKDGIAKYAADKLSVDEESTDEFVIGRAIAYRAVLRLIDIELCLD